MTDARFEAAISRFDALNAKDPNLELESGGSRPRQLVQAERLAAWVERLEPNASEALRLAARCQHLERWAIPRERFPEGRAGYLRWRTELGRFHADRATEILRDVGYPDELVQAVRKIVLKQNLRSNPDSQRMEDALCLSFLEHELASFARRYPLEKTVDILRKTWRKMSPRAHELALALELPEDVRRLVEAALQG